MKKRLLTLQISLALALLALFVFVPLALAGLSTGSGAWEWVNPSVQGNNVNAISFVNSTTGWAAGSAGLVMKTTDGGTNWTSQIPSAFATPAYSCHGVAIGSGCGLRGVFFLDANTGWVVGDSGTIWKTTDGGTIWTDQHPNLPVLGGGYDASPPALRSVHFFNASNGIIVGDSFTFYTSNGGTTWTQGSGPGSSSLMSVQMLSTSTAVAVGGSGAIYKTINSGATWTAKASTPATTSNLSAVSFSTASNGFAVGGDPNGRLLRTTDGGDTWQSNTTVIPAILTGVAIPGGDKLVTSGYSGNIRKYTVDIWNGAIDTVAAGLATVTSGTSNTLITASVAPGTANVFVGGVAGTVLASADSGSTWSPKAGGTAISYYSSSFVDADYGWMVGKSGTVMRTINGGAAWSSDISGIDGTADLYGVDFRTSSLGYAVGSIPGTPNTGVAYRYNAGSWSAMTPLPAGVSYLSEVRMSDDTHGWAVGEEGVILHTTDGANWTKDVPSATYSLNSVDTTSNTDGWAVGSAPCPSGCSGGQTLKGVILKYNGTDWMTIPVTEKFNVNYFTSIDMVSNLVGYAVGYNSNTLTTTGRIFKTTDGGATWNEQTSPTSKLISGVSFLNADTGFLVADEGRIAKTTNGGTNWAIENAGTDVGLNNVSVVSAANIRGYVTYAAGGNGAILKSFIGKSYYWNWYDNYSSMNWVLMANPSSGTAPISYDYRVASNPMTSYMDSAPSGTILAGASAPSRFLNAVGQTNAGKGMVGGPVTATSLKGTKAIASQRSLWKGGNSLEEVLGTEDTKQSSHYYWTWYDNKSPGWLNWVMVSNPSTDPIYYRIKIAGTDPSASLIEGAALGVIPAGQNKNARFNLKGGPVEVETCQAAYVDYVTPCASPANAIASQRVLSNAGTASEAFNEVPGIPVGELSNDYLWTWYDNVSAGAFDWILIANPNATDINYEIRVKGAIPLQMIEGTATGTIAPGTNVTPRIRNVSSGPVEVLTCVGVITDGICGDVEPANNKSIASQRVLWGPSFEEVPGSPKSTLASDYHWTWYDQYDAGTYNWIHIINTNPVETVEYAITVGGVAPSPVVEGSATGTIAPGELVHPRFAKRGGPVEVKAWLAGSDYATNPRSVMTSQRVLWHGYFNEVLGTVLN